MAAPTPSEQLDACVARAADISRRIIDCLSELEEVMGDVQNAVQRTGNSMMIAEWPMIDPRSDIQRARTIFEKIIAIGEK